MWRDLVKRQPLVYRQAAALRERARARRQSREWSAPYLPGHRKRALILDVARKHSLLVLVETGTYEGETSYWLRRHFERIVTVELEPRLFAQARVRLSPYENIETIEGDSLAALPGILASLDSPALFWLDSHACTTKSASGGSPAAGELELILSQPLPSGGRHVVLIDDVRLLGGDGWPTLDELSAIAAAHGRTLEVADDIARVI